MQQTINQMLDHLLKMEGGYTRHPSDPGHKLRVAKGDKYDSYCTNHGVTQYTLSSYWRRQASMEEVKALTPEQARDIYKFEYYRKPRINDLSGELQPLTFDMAVNHGPKRAIKILQITCTKAGYPLTVDGRIGFKTIESADQCYKEMQGHMINAMVEERMKFYRYLVRRNSSLSVFMKGWTKRSSEFIVETETSYIATSFIEELRRLVA